MKNASQKVKTPLRRNVIFGCTFLFSLVLILILSAFRVAPEVILKSYSNSTIVSYNVENLFDTIDDPKTTDEEFIPSGKLNWNTSRYNKKLEHLVEAITLNLDQNPILIGLMEVENYMVVQDLMRYGKMKETNYSLLHKNSPDTRGIDCALIYDRDRFKPLQTEFLEVSIDTALYFHTRDIVYVRGELYGGKEMHVFVNHWPSRRGGEDLTVYKRIRAAEIVRAKVDLILAENPKANIVIMGDLNDHPTDKSVAETLKAKSRKDKKADLIDLMYEDHLAKEGTHYYDGWGCLDHFIVSKALFKGKGKIKLKKKDAVIVKDDKLLYQPKEGQKRPSTTYGADTLIICQFNCN
jgi:predicted extracellular nuclease